MSDFRKPVQARLMWDVVFFWAVATPVCVALTCYGLYRLAIGLYALVRVNEHAMLVIGLVARALWGS